MLRFNLPRRRATLRSAFEQHIKALQGRYRPHIASYDKNPHHEFLRGGAAEQVAGDEEVEQMVNELYLLYSAYERRAGTGWWQSFYRAVRYGEDDLGRDNAAARTLYRNLLGRDLEKAEPQDTRAKMFATLVLSDVSIGSQAFRRFVENTLAEGDSNGKVRFCDKLLRFKELADVQHWFGGDETSADMNRRIYDRQNVVCPYEVNGPERTVSRNARIPYLAKEPLTREGDSGLFRVKLDPFYCRGSIPADWIVQKDVRGLKNNEEDVDRYLRRQTTTHAHIRKTYGFAKRDDKTSIFMKLASCTLLDFMESDRLPSTALVGKVRWFEKILGIAEALKYLHHGVQGPNRDVLNEPIRHGDIKPSNIMLEKDDDGQVIFKLYDFGISTVGRTSSGWSHVDVLEHGPPEDLPKLFPRQSRTIKGDVWSFGCLCLVWLAFVCDGMGDKSGTVGLRAFDTLRRNNPVASADDFSNQRFFIIGEDPDHEEGDCPEKNAASMKQHTDFYTCRKTDEGKIPLLIRLNPSVANYFEKICGKDDERPKEEKRFVSKIVEILTEFALVPNPLQRCNMDNLINELRPVLSEFDGRD